MGNPVFKPILTSLYTYSSRHGEFENLSQPRQRISTSISTPRKRKPNQPSLLLSQKGLPTQARQCPQIAVTNGTRHEIDLYGQVVSLVHSRVTSARAVRDRRLKTRIAAMGRLSGLAYERLA